MMVEAPPFRWRGLIACSRGSRPSCSRSPSSRPLCLAYVRVGAVVASRTLPLGGPTRAHDTRRGQQRGTAHSTPDQQLGTFGEELDLRVLDATCAALPSEIPRGQHCELALPRSGSRRTCSRRVALGGAGAVSASRCFAEGRASFLRRGRCAKRSPTRSTSGVRAAGSTANRCERSGHALSRRRRTAERIDVSPDHKRFRSARPTFFWPSTGP